MKVSIIIVLLVLFNLGILVSAQSDARTDFTISGCANVPAGTCFRNNANPLKSYFCEAISAEVSEEQNVFSIQEACFGLDNVLGGGDDCCPSGYYCSLDGLCELSEYSCDFWTENSCDGLIDGCSGLAVGEPSCNFLAGCFWLIDECVDQGNLGCLDYTSDAICNEDPHGFGQSGLGTEVCNSGEMDQDSGMVVVPDSCRCEWDLGDGVCKLAWNVEHHLEGRTGDWFECFLDQSLSNCLNGQQTLSWIATYEAHPSTYDPTPDLEGGDCVTGSKSLSCGQALAKLPFFGLFNIISVLIGLGLFYLVFKKF